MPWVMRVDTTDYPVIDASKATVSADLLKLNEARVICSTSVSAGTINVDTEVKIIDQVVDPVTKTITEEHTLLHGYIEKYSQQTHGQTKNTHEYSVKELAGKLEKYRVHVVDTTNYTVNFGDQTTSEYVSGVLANTGWTKGTGDDWNLRATQFRYMTVIAGLNKVVTELSAASAATPLYMWFDNTAKTVSWGATRNVRTSVNFTKGLYYDYKEEKTIRNQVAGVVIYGANSASHGQWPESPSGHNLAVYQYDDATSNNECTDIAKAVYNTWTCDPKRRIQFKLRPIDTKVSGSYIVEGDRIQVDGIPYNILDMTYTQKEVIVGVNGAEDSVLYSLGDKLRPMAGTSSGITEIEWAPGRQNVSSDGTTETDFILNISDIANISPSTGIPMKVSIGAYETYGSPAQTGVSTDNLSTAIVPRGFQSNVNNLELSNASVMYLPVTGAGNFLETPTLEGGFSYAHAHMDGQIVNDETGNNFPRVYIKGCYLRYGFDTTWHEASDQSIVMVANKNTDEHAYDMVSPFAISFIIPGCNQTTKLFVNWQIKASCSTHVHVYWATTTVDVVPRHNHPVIQSGQPTNTILSNQNDNLKKSTVTPPGSITCKINDGTPFSVANNSTTPIESGKGLISGVNHIKFTSNTICTVAPSATYQMYGS